MGLAGAARFPLPSEPIIGEARYTEVAMYSPGVRLTNTLYACSIKTRGVHERVNRTSTITLLNFYALELLSARSYAYRSRSARRVHFTLMDSRERESAFLNYKIIFVTIRYRKKYMLVNEEKNASVYIYRKSTLQLFETLFV